MQFVNFYDTCCPGKKLLIVSWKYDRLWQVTRQVTIHVLIQMGDSLSAGAGELTEE